MAAIERRLVVMQPCVLLVIDSVIARCIVVQCLSRPIPHRPPQPLPINTLTIAPLPLTAPDAGSGSSEQSVTDKVLVMDPIKRLERELAMINQEMKMMRKQKSELEKELAGKSDQLHRTQKELAEMVVAQVVMRHVQREKQKRQDEIDKGTQSNEIGSELCVNYCV